ncbi:peptidoglycan DD-metalloendopeptidase family protein [Cytobacillus sp. FSL R5-0569]|uniref:peptidoglycan DD-metalloendopeptidase family protein n=1 Tax=Cytobacillus sp. FSL R5-0569 TaxID=2921649 RepID=UPI0030FA4E4E
MQDRIRGLSIDLGLNTMGIDSGLTNLKSKLKTVNSEMNANLSSFDRAERSVNKYQTVIDGLNRKLQVQSQITDQARKRYQKMVEQHGEGSSEAEKAAQAYNQEVAALNNLNRSIERNTSELSRMQEEQRIAASGWTRLGDSAETSGRRISGIGNGLKGLGQNLSMSITAPLVAGFAAVTKGTEEFRGDMARLETNAQEAGKGVDFAREAMERLSGISDETDSNVEAVSNLLATDLSEGGLIKTMDALSGAAIKFSDTLKIEGLADGLQETLATGAAIGPFAEMLERSGVDLEKFNKGLSKSIKSGKEEDYVLQQLSKLGLADVNEAYRKNNEELVKSREASFKFEESVSKLGTTLTPIATKITEAITGIVDKFNNLDGETQKTIIKFTGLAMALGPIIGFGGVFLALLGNIVSGFAPVLSAIGRAGGLFKVLRLGLMAFIGPVGIVIGILTLLGTGFITLYKNSDTFRLGISNLLGNLKKLGKDLLEMLKPAIDAVVSFFKEQLAVIKGFWEENKNSIVSALENIYKFIKFIFEKGILPVIQFVMPFILSIIQSVWTNIKGVITGALNIIMGVVKVFSGLFTGDFKKMWEGVKQIFSGAVELVWNLIQLYFIGRIVKGIGGFVKTFGSKLKGGWDSAIGGIKSFVGKAKDWFTSFKDEGLKNFNKLIDGAKALPGKMGSGIKKMAGKVSDGVKSVANKMAEGLGKGVNGVIGGVNWVLGKLSVKTRISEWEVPKYAHGTEGHKGGLAIVGDGKGSNAGRELITTPDGKSMLSPSKDTLLNLPKGSQVLSAKETKSLLGDVPKYAHGTGGMISGAINKIKDVALNIWDYATNPSKILNIALDTLGIVKPDNTNVVGKIARGGFNMVKDNAIDYVKSMFAKAEQDLGVPGKLSFPGFTFTSPFGQRWGKLHGGVDYAAPTGTPIPSQTAGVVSYASNGFNGGFGNLVKVKQGAFEHYYAHMSRILASVGQSVKRGTALGLVGSTGNSTGPHVHYELRKNGVRLNPLNAFKTGGLINTHGLYELADGGYPEYVIPTDPSKRTAAMKLLALAGKKIQGNKRPNQLSGVGTHTNESNELLNAVLEQNQILMSLLQSSRSIECKPVLSERDIGRAYDKYNANEQAKHSIFKGRVAPV